MYFRSRTVYTLHVKTTLKMTLKKLLLLLFVGLMSSAFAFSADDQGEETNLSDNQGRKQGRWIYLGKDRPTMGYPEEGKIEEGSYENDRREGIWVKYHRDGVTRRLEGTYVNNRPSGPFIKYHANGEVKEKGTWDRNKYKDTLTRVYENGVIEYEAIYNNEGKEEGAVKFYYPNGQIEFEYTSLNGIATGEAVRYYENGDVKEIINYGTDGSVIEIKPVAPVNPPVTAENPSASKEKAPKVDIIRTKGAEFKPNDYNKLFNSDDEIWQDGYFRNGSLWNGKVYEYDSDGILLKVKVFKNGVYHSDGQL